MESVDYILFKEVSWQSVFLLIKTSPFFLSFSHNGEYLHFKGMVRFTTLRAEVDFSKSLPVYFSIVRCLG